MTKLFAFSLLLIAGCATVGKYQGVFADYALMRFGTSEGIENLSLTNPVKIQGYVGTNREARGIFASEELAHSENLTCLEISPSDVERYMLKEGQKILAAGRVSASQCSSDNICFTACPDYIFDIEHVDVIDH